MSPTPLSGFVRVVRSDEVHIVDADQQVHTLPPANRTVLLGLRPSGFFVNATVGPRGLEGWQPAAPPTRPLQRHALEAAAGASPELAKALVAHAPERLLGIFEGNAHVIPIIVRQETWKEDPETQAAIHAVLTTYVAAVGCAFAVRLVQFGVEHGFEVPWALAVQLSAAFDDDERLPQSPGARLELLKENPWCVYIPLGISLPAEQRHDLHALVEAMATAQGIAPDDDRRIVGAVYQETYEEVRKGHIYSPWAIAHVVKRFRLPRGRIYEILKRRGIFTSRVPDPNHPEKFLTGASPMGLAMAERAIANLLVAPRLMPGTPVAIPAGLSDDQADAATALLTHPLTILAGAAGTGKTHVLATCARYLASRGRRVVLLATTGIAAQRLGNAADLPAQTLHSFIGYAPAAGRLQPPASSLEPIDWLVVDEASMLDSATAGRLADFLGKHNTDVARVCLAGDPWQLPPVGPGRPFHDLIEADVPTARLTTIRRTDVRELITMAYQLATDGRWEPAFAMAPHVPRQVVSTAAEAAQAVARLADQWNIAVSAIGVLAPHYEGPLGITALNAALRAQQHPTFTEEWAVGDAVIQTCNWRVTDDLTIWNGQVGTVAAVTRLTLTVQFGNDTVTYPQTTASQLLTHAYALSVHRAQGGQYGAAVFVVDPDTPLDRALVYTAVTRAINHLAILHPPDAVWEEPLKPRVTRRRTLLPFNIEELILNLDTLTLV